MTKVALEQIQYTSLERHKSKSWHMQPGFKVCIRLQKKCTHQSCLNSAWLSEIF